MNLRHTLRVALLLFLGIMGLALTVELLTGGLGACTPCLTEDAQDHIRVVLVEVLR